MDTEPKFLTKLAVTPLPDGRNWQLVEELKFEDANGFIHCVPAGFTTDFASIPSLSLIGARIGIVGWLLMLVAELGFQSNRFAAFGCVLILIGLGLSSLADKFNDDDLLDGPATLHDDGYRRQRLGQTSWVLKFYWDWILFIAMRANGEPLWKCWVIWFNVAAFGWFAWYQDGGGKRS